MPHPPAREARTSCCSGHPGAGKNSFNPLFWAIFRTQRAIFLQLRLRFGSFLLGNGAATMSGLFRAEAMASERHRLLIADEVGLGKTIEAGLILTELRQRAPMRRVLIIPPSHLIIKWREEMRRRFDFEFDILDTSAMLRFLDRYEEEREEATLLGIISLQAFRGRRLQERWNEVAPGFDLVVFDEAGRLRNPETLSHNAARDMAENAEAVLLLTATPVQTDNSNLFHLLRLLDPVEFDSVEVFQRRLEANQHILDAQRLLLGGQLEEASEVIARVEGTSLRERFVGNPLYSEVLDRLAATPSNDRRGLVEIQRDLTALNVLGHIYSRSRKRDVEENRVVRVARAFRVPPTEHEIGFYDAVTEQCRERYAYAGGTVAAFQSIMTERQLASSMAALLGERIHGRRETRGDSSELGDVSAEDVGGQFDEAKVVESDELGLGGLHHLLKRLEADDSKFNGLLKALRWLKQQSADEKVVVFAYFKPTLRYLERRLRAKGIGCLRIDGDVRSDPLDPERDERGKRIEQFRDDPNVRVLLSSEVGDEGIDLQFASVLANYDLPWNPMRVEQRIGRIDRLGQKADRITIINLALEGTVEDRILSRLYDRIGIFERSIGDLEEILGDEIASLQKALFSPEITDEQRVARLEQTALAIERRRDEMERFEAQSDRLLGNEQFFRDEIDEARTSKRFVGGRELLIYLGDFLKRHHPKCRLEELEPDRRYHLDVEPSLRQLVIQSVPGEDLGRRQFLARAMSGAITFTIDQVLANERRELEFLTFHHPLIRAVRRYYEQHGDEIHPVSYVAMESDLIPAGRYVWFLYYTEITGARPDRDLSLVVFPEGATTPLSEGISSELLTELTVRASAVPSGKRQLDVSPEVCAAAGEEIATHIDARVEERRRVNDALVENRLSSLRESHERKRRIQEGRLKTATERQRAEGYLKSIEGRIRNMEASFKERCAQIEAGRQLGRSLDLRGAGGLEVRRRRAAGVAE